MKYVRSLNLWSSPIIIQCDACNKTKDKLIEFIWDGHYFRGCFECICNEKNHFEKLYKLDPNLVARCIVYMKKERLLELEKRYINKYAY